MADPLSIVSGVAGVMSLAGAVLVTGYKYLASARSSRKEVSELLEVIAALNTVLSQLVTHSVSSPTALVKGTAYTALISRGVLTRYEAILREVETLLIKYKHVDDQVAANMAKALTWPLKEKTVANLTARLKNLQEACQFALAIDGAAALQRLEEKLSQLTLDEQIRDQERKDSGHDLLENQKHTLDAVTALTNTFDTTQSRKILLWLSLLDSSTKQVNTLALRQPGTGVWLPERPLFQQWRNDGGFLWLNGPSGIGKTVLVSAVIDSISTSTSQPNTNDDVIFHYCDFTNPETLDAVKVFGSLARQISMRTPQIPPKVYAYYDSHVGREHDLMDLVSLVAELINESPRRCYIVIDALDECSSREPLLRAILKLFESVSDKPRIRLLVVSRPELDISQAFITMPTLSINANDVVKDISTHVSAEIEGLPRFKRLKENIKRFVTSEVVYGADGMFRWAQCQLDILKASRSPEALLQALKNQPVGLENTYDRMFESIKDEDTEYVQRCLCWLLGSLRPLSLEQLVEAIAINPASREFNPNERLMVAEEVMDMCRSLIHYNSGDNTIALAHYSVQEYLLSPSLAAKPPRIARFSVRQAECGHKVTVSLLSYTFTAGRQIQDEPRKVVLENELPLIEYARSCFVSHLRAEDDGVYTWIKRLSTATKGPSLQSWISLLLKYTGPSAPIPENCQLASFVHVVAEFTLMRFLENQSTKQTMSQLSPEDSRAFQSCKEELGRLQLAWEAKAQSRDLAYVRDNVTGVSPLAAASTYGFPYVLTYLLDHGATLNGLSRLGNVGNPLALAALYNQRPIVKILIERGAEINHRAGPLDTILICAARRSTSLVSHLLDLGADPNIPDRLGLTIHYWAARCDSKLRDALDPALPRLRSLQRHDPDHVDLQIRRQTILGYVHTARFQPDQLSIIDSRRGYHALYLSGMVEAAAILAELHIVRSSPIRHEGVCCDQCSGGTNSRLVGTRYMCLDCIDTDVCADCYHRLQANPNPPMCKGHRFAEIPRRCWYTLPLGVVTEKGETLDQVLEEIQSHWEKVDVGDEHDTKTEGPKTLPENPVAEGDWIFPKKPS